MYIPNASATDYAWTKASYSGGQNDCVETAHAIPAGHEWTKSTYSDGGNNCVEVAFAATSQAVRDSKRPTGPAIVFPAAAWSAFVEVVKTEDIV